METINTVELSDPEVYPTESILKNILGDTYSIYLLLLEVYEKNGMKREWRYYKDGKAWLCKVQLKKRTIVWMSAWKGYMQATIYIPEKFINDINGLKISNEVRELIKNSKNTGKSKPCIFKITKKENLDDFTSIMQFKINAK